MAEALPGNPGHVGHTPQHVGEAIDRSRRRGLETSAVTAAMLDEHYPLPDFLCGSTPNPQRYGHVATEHTLAAADEFSRRERQLAPWQRPVSKWPLGFLVERLPLPFNRDRANRAQRPEEEATT